MKLRPHRRIRKSPEVRLRLEPDGLLTITNGKFYRAIDVRDKTPAEKLEAVRWVLLLEGVVFTEKIEKIVIKALFR